MELIIALLMLLVAAWIFGEVAERLKQPAIIGQLIAGIILGPTLLAFLDPLSLDAGDATKITLEVISTLAIFFVVFYAGLEMQMQDLFEVIAGKGLYFAIGSFIVTFLVGFTVGFHIFLGFTASLFLGLCIAITALPVSVKILTDMGKLHTRTGHAIVGTAVVHDIISITVLGLLIGISVNPEGADSFWLGVEILKIFLFICLVFGTERAFHVRNGWLAKRFSSLMSRVRSKEAQFSIAIIVALYFAAIAEFLGLSYILGAFYGGLLFSPKILGAENYFKLKKGVSGIALGFFAPIFIAYLGLMFNMRELYAIFGVFLGVLFIAMGSMFASGYLGARMAGYTHDQSLVIGTGINARGMMEMVVALIGLKYGFIDRTFFSILIGMALVTTLITPWILKRLYKRCPEETTDSDLPEEFRQAIIKLGEAE
ncbi:MAG: cation:proton antiporter [Euryarchaeota archaeon]|nr:cation:proton antiporter [Euryarchaeota archaeon]